MKVLSNDQMNTLAETAEKTPISNPKADHREDVLTRSIEQQTAKLPSDVFLLAAFGSIAISLVAHLSGKPKERDFVANWVPTLLILGVYNKLVKLHGSDGV